MKPVELYKIASEERGRQYWGAAGIFHGCTIDKIDESVTWVWPNWTDSLTLVDPSKDYDSPVYAVVNTPAVDTNGMPNAYNQTHLVLKVLHLPNR